MQTSSRRTIENIKITFSTKSTVINVRNTQYIPNPIRAILFARATDANTVLCRIPRAARIFRKPFGVCGAVKRTPSPIPCTRFRRPITIVPPSRLPVSIGRDRLTIGAKISAYTEPATGTSRELRGARVGEISPWVSVFTGPR